MTLWLYKCVIIPNITYAAAVRCDRILARSELQHLQRAARIRITGAMRRTLTKVLEMFLNRPSLGTMVESAALMAAYCLPRPDLKNLGIGYNFGFMQKQMKWTVSSEYK